MMELIAPAGNLEKLTYAWEYGADAAYIGLKQFSLRVKADNFHGEEHRDICELKKSYAERGKPKRLLCAMNISFTDAKIDELETELDWFAGFPFDAFIIQDPGLIDILTSRFPQTALHLSTQANCINARAARFWQQQGFKRLVLGREASLDDIRRIKDAAPELELECFAHGAMCIAYSGRCLISATLTGRSANAGHCTHSCRWDWRVLEERERKGEYFPVLEGEDFTALLSSKDLCMIDHLEDMAQAGVDALKIEGRMKSLYYTALVSRAYRKAIDAQAGIISSAEAAPYISELDNVAHRAFTTGFYYSRTEANSTTKGESSSPYLLAGVIGSCVARYEDGTADWQFTSMNKMNSGTPIEFIGPDSPTQYDTAYTLIDPATGMKREWVCHGHPCLIRTDAALDQRHIVRFRDPEYQASV